MRVKATSPDRTRTWKSGLPPTYVNTVTHWWDGSQIYGSTEERNRELRAGEGGRMMVEDGRLPNETKADLDGVDLTGFSDNYWIGLSLLHTLFVKEHNAICDHLAGHYPSWDDEQLFLTARLVNSALMAKIHTVEWTPGILANPVLERAMHSNWYGLLPTWVRDRFGHLGTEMIGGIVGSKQAHHAAPYSITEEFVSVYRLHPLLPDDYEIRDHRNGELIAETDFDPLQGHGMPAVHGRARAVRTSTTRSASRIRARSRSTTIRGRSTSTCASTATASTSGRIDVLRDRERGVRRYNDFREALRKRARREVRGPHRQPRVGRARSRSSTTATSTRWTSRSGLLAEPLPPGFGFSDTAFRIFILMASRRLRVGPLLHRRLHARRLHARGNRVGGGQHDESTCCCATTRSWRRRSTASTTRSRRGSRLNGSG